MRGWAAGLALIAAGCLSAPPDSVAFDAGDQSFDAGVDPCDGVPASGCALFSCEVTGSCYRLCSQPETMAAAECDGGSQLLETETRDELECARTNNGDSMWIGLVQGDSEEVDAAWTWQSSGLAPETTYWDPVEPNDDPTEGEDGEEQCAIIAEHSGEWADVACDVIIPTFVCEYPPP